VIIDLIVAGLKALVDVIMALIPSYTLPVFADVAGPIGSGMAKLGAVFPVDVLGWCLAAVLVVRLFVWGFDLVVFVWSIIPFKAT
jgi:hypothetical protein